jgi:hypothetical protein
MYRHHATQFTEVRSYWPLTKGKVRIYCGTDRSPAQLAVARRPTLLTPLARARTGARARHAPSPQPGLIAFCIAHHASCIMASTSWSRRVLLSSQIWSGTRCLQRRLVTNHSYLPDELTFGLQKTGPRLRERISVTLYCSRTVKETFLGAALLNIYRRPLGPSCHPVEIPKFGTQRLLS